MRIKVDIAGTPQGKPAPRFRAVLRKDGRPALVRYPGKSAEHWERAIYSQLAEYVPEEPLDEPVAVTAVYRIMRPKSHYGAKGLRPKFEDVRHAQKPDLDNLNKALDTLTHMGIWRDDARVWCCLAAKIWTIGNPGLDLQIETGPPEWFNLMSEAAAVLSHSENQKHKDLAYRIYRFLGMVKPTH